MHTLPVDYLKAVIEKMTDYGDRVQFSLASPGSPPVYRVLNPQDKAMAFDKNHHLLQPQEDAFEGANGSAILTIDQVKAVLASGGKRPAAGSRAKSTPRAGTGAPRVTAAKLEEQFATQRYEYFKNNRATLPATITQHTDEVTDLMKSGKSVEEAFDEVVKKYF
jgi:hypothetical protein